MNDDLDPTLEARLRAHYADRADREPLPADDGPPTARSPRRWPVLVALTAAAAIAAAAFAVTLADDDGSERLDLVTPSSTATEPAPTTTARRDPSTTTSSTPASSGTSVIVAVEGVLGWWDGTRFVAWTGGARVPAEGGEVYDVVGIGTAPRSVTGGPPEDGCEFSEPQGITIDVGITIDRPEVRLGPPPIAITGVRDVMPRRVVQLAGDDPAHVRAAADALAGIGVDDGAPPLVQVVRADVDDDGVDEVLMVAERLSDPETLYAQRGDYSVLLLRQVIDGSVVTTVVAASIVAPDADDAEVFITPYRVSAIADLNGDGTMELVTRGVYYEGSGTAAHRVLPQGGTEQIFAVGCGV